MEFFGTFLTACLIALLVGAALSFGFILLIWFVALAMAIAGFIMLREAWRRWMFLRAGNQQVRSTSIIEGEYQEITHKEDNYEN